MKCCSKCQAVKAESEFAPSTTKRCGTLSYCRPCMKAYQAAYREANAEKRKQWFADNRENMYAISAAWSVANRPRRNASNARRHAAKLRATPGWANASAILRLYEEAAVTTKRTGVEHEVDHIIPLQGANVCGLHCEANLRVITATENQRKKNKFTAGISG